MRKPTYSVVGKTGVTDVLKAGKSESGSMYGGIILSDPAPVELKRRAARGRSGREGRGICGRTEGRSEENYGVSV